MKLEQFKLKIRNLFFSAWQNMRLIMGKLVLVTFNETHFEIDEDQIFVIIEEGAVLLVVYKNGTYDRFPAISRNLEIVAKFKVRFRPV